jgi:SPP1 family predicted phage head-tail adaptor
MGAGKYDRKVELQRATDTPDTYGERTSAWASYAYPWAEIRPLSARQVEQARSFSDTVTHAITMRYRSDLRQSDRIKYGTRLFQIDGFIEVGRRVETLIYATERVN